MVYCTAMLRLDLTLETGSKEIEENPECFEFQFESDDPYLLSIRDAQETETAGGVVTDAQVQATITAWAACPLRATIFDRGLSRYETHIQELLINAFEHGSVWGEAGPIRVRILRSGTNDLFLVTIEQPLEGFDVQRIRDHVQVKVGNALRGGGLAMVRHETDSTFGFESIDAETAKFRSLMIGHGEPTKGLPKP